MDTLLDEAWIKRLMGFDQLIVGFSGGLDSTVLVHALASYPALLDTLHAVHVHHGLSIHATSWQRQCESFCAKHRIVLTTHYVVLASRANLEEEARNARLRVFESLLREKSCLLLAHHRDDQAETLMLQLCRGAGVDGLAGIPPHRRFATGELARPLLQASRDDLRVYAKSHALTWVDDESNEDPSFSRNYVRHHIMPLLRDRWPAVARAMSRCAMHCQQAKSNLDDLAQIDCPELAQSCDRLSLDPLSQLTKARLGNVLRVWLTNQGVRAASAKRIDRLVHDVIFAGQDRTPSVQWGAFQVRRYRQTLYFLRAEQHPSLCKIDWPLFPEPLLGYLNASPVSAGLHVPAGHVVDVRFRTGGETLVWKGKTRVLKTLFQAWGVPPWLRERVPLIYVDGKLAAVLDFCVSDPYYGAHGDRLYRIERSS